MAALCAFPAQAADECGPLSAAGSSQTVVCSSGPADDDYDTATEGNIFYQISDRDADYRFELKAGARIVGKRDGAQVTAADQTDDHGRRHNALLGRWANYGAFFVDTGNRYEGDITIRSEADIEAGNNDGVTIDQATIRARGIYALHRGKAGDINIQVAGGSIASTGAGIQATIDNFSSGCNISIRSNRFCNTPLNDLLNDDFRDHQFKGNINIDLSPGATIRTSGHAGSGVEAQHRGHGGIRLVAEGKAGSDEPDIETTGDDASGISVEMGNSWGPRVAETGDIGVNLKNYFIRTTGDRGVLQASGLRVYNYMDGAIDVDVAGSKVHTKGARGIFAFHQGAGKIDIDVKDSEVETGSRTANPSEHGIIGQHQSRGLVAIKVGNSRVSTQADGSHGVYGRHIYRGDVMITMRGNNRISTRGAGSHGVYGRHQFALGESFPNRGNVDIDVDGGQISTQGAESHGIYGHHEKEGSVAIRAKNADIRTAGAGARGIYALQMDKSKEIRIEVDGGSIAAGCQKPEDPDDDECRNTGIFASFGDGNDTAPQGVARIGISRAVVRGGDAVAFKGGRGVLNLADSRLAGNVLFADGDYDDVLSITQRSGSGRIGGSVNFRGGDDELALDIASGQHFVFGGPIFGLHTLTKKGGGWARFADAVHFSGSSLNLDDGYLVIAGHLNIGDGTLTVRNAGRLVFEAGLGGALGDALGFGQISVGRLHFEGDGRPFVLVQLDEGLSKDQADQARKLLAQFGDRLNLIYSREVTQGSGGTKVSSLDLRSESDGGIISKVGTVKINEGTGDGALEEGAEDRIGQLRLPGTFVAGTGDSGASGSGAGGGGSGGGGGILGLGLLAVLLGTFLGGGDEADADAGFAEYGLGLARPAHVAAADERGVLTLREAGGRPYRLWVRTGAGAQALPMAGVPGLGADGAEIGFSLRGGDGFHLSASVAPEAAARADSLRLSAEGSALALGAGWSDGRRFAGLRLSQGDFEAASVVANPAAGGALLSTARLRVAQAQLRAGLHLDAGALRWTPSAALRAGSLEQAAHAAEGPALRAEVPAFGQDYAGWQLGLRMASRGWLDFAGGKWRPQLKLETIRTSAGGDRSAGLAQSDRLGALSFTTRAGIRALPETVHSLSFGAQVKALGSARAAWRFGLAGLEADGEQHYAALAGYRLRF